MKPGSPRPQAWSTQRRDAASVEPSKCCGKSRHRTRTGPAGTLESRSFAGPKQALTPLFFVVTQRRVLTVALLLVCGTAAVAVHGDDRWPFRRPQPVVPPAVEGVDPSPNGIDAFILAQLRAHGLSWAPAASPEQLLRRVYFDLIGLPPTPAEVDAFVEDPDPRAYEKVVDRLLADSRYGERWARLWLDLARYADTAGYEGDPDLPHAWRYRDYVIDAFNNDKPYDSFIKEQIAGDEFQEIMGAGDLPGNPPERVVALTFLRLAPFTEPRGDETRHELLSEMTSTVGEVFLGLTVGCAKCHDHKYDRIPTKDFYRMKAFFSTIQIPRPEPGDGYQIGGPSPAAFYRPGEKEWAQRERQKYQQQVADAKKELEAFRADVMKRVDTAKGAGLGLQMLGKRGNNYVFGKTSVSDGALHLTVVNSDSQDWQFFTDESGPNAEGSLSGRDQGEWFADLSAPRHITLGQHTAGTGKPAGAGHEGHFAELILYDHPLNEQERRHVAGYVQRKYQGSRAGAEQPPLEGVRLWLDAADLDGDAATPNPSDGHRIAAWTDKIAGIRLEQRQSELQPTLGTLGESGAPAVRFQTSFLAGDVSQAPFLADQRGALVLVYSATHRGEGYGLEIGGEETFLSTVIYPSAVQPKFEELLQDQQLVTDAERQRYRYLSGRASFVKQHLKRLQPVAMSLRHSYGPPYEPGVPTSRVMIRGEYDQPGEVVKAGFLSCITGHQRPATIRLDPFKRWPTRSRRMALANWIASADNPLTARVLVNRLWHWHFGGGLVATPSDFGKLSGGPSHPELLDWLANQFISARWSIKAMHRLMVTSRTYRQTSQHANPPAREIDPENRMLWRYTRRRLSAEAVRDSVLAVSGRLNPEQFGLPIFPPLPGDVAEAVKYTDSKWDTQHGPEGRKRSIYIYQQRTLTMPLMQVFDSLVCDQSRPRRRTSITPLQALAMYNGEFVNEEANYFAERVRNEAGDDPAAQIDHAFRLALCRLPTAKERARLSQFRQVRGSSPESLTALCRILYNTNEFMYID